MSFLRRTVLVSLITLCSLSAMAAQAPRDDESRGPASRAIGRVIKLIRHIFTIKPLDDPMPPHP